MRRLTMANTDFVVSALCLGTVQYGTGCPEDQAMEQLDQFLDYGGNLIDSAHVYGDWAPGERSRSEKVIGKWIAQRGRRHELVISTKGGHPPLSDSTSIKMQSAWMARELEDSLRNLQTDCIDIYSFHRDNTDIAVEELLTLMESFVKDGKIKYYGCSNWTLERVCEAQAFAAKNGMQGFVSNQIMDCLALVSDERNDGESLVYLDERTCQYHSETKLNVMAYMAMSLGYFPAAVADRPIKQIAQDLFTNECNCRLVKKMKALQLTSEQVVSLMLQYVLSRPYVSIPMASFRSCEQMHMAISCCDDSVGANILSQVKQIKGW